MRIGIKIEEINYIANQYENTLKYIKLRTVDINSNKNNKNDCKTSNKLFLWLAWDKHTTMRKEYTKMIIIRKKTILIKILIILIIIKVTAIKLNMKPWVLKKITFQTLSSVYNFSFLILLFF